MRARIQWLAAADTAVEVHTPGERWQGTGQHPDPVLTLTAGHLIAIEGSHAELRALAARITALTAAAATRPDLTRTSSALRLSTQVPTAPQNIPDRTPSAAPDENVRVSPGRIDRGER